MPREQSQSLEGLWAYAYLIVPAQAENLLDALRAIVDRENLDAESGARIWTGRLVLESRITHILIVSDSSDQNREINRLLESELRLLKAEFFLTNPLKIQGYPEVIGEPAAHSGNGRAPILPPRIPQPETE